MKKTIVFAGLIVALTALSTTASGQVTTGDLFRETYASVIDQLPPYDGLSDAVSSEEAGIFEGHPSVWWEDGHAQANHSSEIVASEQTISLTGTLQGDMGRGIPGETNFYEARNLILAEFNSVGSFVIEGSLDIQGTNHESIVSIIDLQTMDIVFTTGVNPPSGDFRAVCSGAGSYRLEVIHHLQVYQADTGGSDAVMHFSMVLAPENPVAVQKVSWSGIKVLFR